MDDLRQKLFPIFLGEAERNLTALRQFLDHEDLSLASAEELETAFRAAHTLKGTANLVKADSICKIARRLEAMLEKHFEDRTKPTRVEHEAMRLAVDWLAPLVSALQGDLQEPKLFVAEALQALDLAEKFPGRTPLVELLDSQAEQRAPQLDDPFSDDPDLLTEEDQLLQSEPDPFADDPHFGIEIDGGLSVQKVVVPRPDIAAGSDPFAEDLDLAIDSPDLQDIVAEKNDVDSAEEGNLPFDPFAEDELGVEVSTVEDLLDVFPGDDSSERLTEENKYNEGGPSPEILEADFADDPFADDEDFTSEVALTTKAVNEGAAEVDIAGDSLVPPTDIVAARAEEIAESLLLPQDETAPRKDYVCCVFSVGGHDYHLPIKQMIEISDLPQVLPLPLAPPMVSGLTNLRGRVLPVINLAILNQHQLEEVRVQHRLVIAEHEGESLAFLADGIPFLAEEFSGEKIDMSKFLSLYRVRGGES
ncbi:chemotaxis protein CheW [Malonomonas rubra]|uniref:chemotaxis protein CheW n=1 Tax=Malonomonas rubra TaxID=57040 RepID=UPI0026EC5DF8|nr:chemotaxis protein CheW [Malonomonas rubra]